MLNKTLNV